MGGGGGGDGEGGKKENRRRRRRGHAGTGKMVEIRKKKTEKKL